MINIKTGWLNSVFMVSIGFSVLARDRPQMSQPKGPRRNRALTPIFSPIFSLEDADAPGRLADRDVLDAGVLGGVDDRYAVRSAVRDVDPRAVAGQRHVPGAVADPDGRDDLVGGGVDHHHAGVAAVAHVQALAVRVHR